MEEATRARHRNSPVLTGHLGFFRKQVLGLRAARYLLGEMPVQDKVEDTGRVQGKPENGQKGSRGMEGRAWGHNCSQKLSLTNGRPQNTAHSQGLSISRNQDQWGQSGHTHSEGSGGEFLLASSLLAFLGLWPPCSSLRLSPHRLPLCVSQISLCLSLTRTGHWTWSLLNTPG